MGKSHGRKTVVALAGAAVALATGWVSVGVIGSASAAENDFHPLVVQRVWNNHYSHIVGSVMFSDTASTDSWCINLNGDEYSWTDADSSVRVREGHSYKVGGYDGQNCTGPGYGQANSANADVPIGLSTQKFWYAPNFQAD